MYWEGQKDIEMITRMKDHHNIFVFMVHIVSVDEKSMQQVK